MARRHRVDVPEGESGDWKIKRFTVSEEDEKFGRLQAIMGSSSMGRFTPAGTYTGLYRRGGIDGWSVIMSDTPDEIRDHLGFIYQVKGRVLIHGLGLGMCARAALIDDEVTHLTVVENSPDVIKLVGPWLTELAKKHGKEVVIIEADCFTWKPVKGAWWDVVWHDVWDNLCIDNLQEMAKLHRRFGRRCGWQGSWGKENLQDRRRQERAQGW